VSAPPVTVAPVEARTVTDRILATGELVAVDEASIAAELPGRVTGVLAEEGAAVSAGDALLEIDREKRQLELDNQKALLAEAETAVSQARRERDRIRSLHARKAASQSRLDEAETAVRSALSRVEASQAQLGLAERALRDASVAAPFAGLVARRYVSVGEYVSVGQKLFDLVALDPVEVVFHLSERDSSLVKIGDQVGVRVAPFPDEVFPATVDMISPRIDPRTRTLRVKARLDNDEGRLRPGLFARADLGVAQRENVPMLPEEAVLQRSDGSVVFALGKDRRVQRRNVRLGVFRDGWVEAVEGVAAGELVVVRGQARLIDGSPVDVRRPDGSPLGAPEMAGEPRGAGTVP
jgi:membrane fusion protein, multidrug efflux system